MNEKSEKKWIATKKFFSEALLVAILTATGYLGAFSYQYAFLRYFSIPAYLVDPNLSSVLFTSLIALILFTLISTVFVFVFSRNLKQKHERLIVWVLISIIAWSPFIAVAYDPYSKVVTIIRLIIVLVFIMASSISIYRGSPSQMAGNVISKLEEVYGSFPVLFVLVIFMFICYCGIAGSVVARFQSQYLVTNTYPERAVLAVYGDNFITIAFSTTTQPHSFDNQNIVLLPSGQASSANTIFSQENIGPLFDLNINQESLLSPGNLFFGP